MTRHDTKQSIEGLVKFARPDQIARLLRDIYKSEPRQPQEAEV